MVQDVVSDQVLSQLVGSISGEEDGVREAMQTVLQAAIDATNELMTVDAGKPLGKDWVTGVADGIHEDGHKVQDEMGTVFNNMLAALQAVVDSGTFNRIGTAISSGIAVGIRSGTGAVVQAARSAARQAYYAARTELNVNSPSKKTRESANRIQRALRWALSARHRALWKLRRRSATLPCVPRRRREAIHRLTTINLRMLPFMRRGKVLRLRASTTTAWAMQPPPQCAAKGLDRRQW